MLTTYERTILESSLKMVLLSLLENKMDENIEKFINENITYEQLLNIVFNNDKTKKQPIELLEGIALGTLVYYLAPVNESMTDYTIFGIIKNATKEVMKIKQKHPQLFKFVKRTGVIVGAAVVATYFYNVKLAKYVNACKGKPVAEMRNCIRQVKIRSLKDTLSGLKTAQSKCDYIEIPEDAEYCKQEYQHQIELIYDRLSKLTKRLDVQK